MGVWSTSSTRPTASQPRISLQPASGTSLCAALGADQVHRLACSTSRASVDLPEPETPVTTVRRPSGTRAFTRLQVVQIGADDFDRAAWPCVTARRGCSGCCSGSRRKRPVSDFGEAISSAAVPRPRRGRRACRRRGRDRSRDRRGGWCLRRARPPPAYCPWLRACPACRAGCGCRADAGRWSVRRGCSRRRAGSSRVARRGGCAALRRPTASARRGRARDSRGRRRRGSSGASCSSATMSRAISASRPSSESASKKSAGVATDSAASSAIERSRKRTLQRDRVEALAVAGWGRARLAFEPVVPPDFLAGLFLVEAFDRQAGAVAGLAPAVLGVVREQARIEFREARAAGRAGALGGEHGLRHLCFDLGAVTLCASKARPAHRAGPSLGDALAVFQRLGERGCAARLRSPA